MGKRIKAGSKEEIWQTKGIFGIVTVRKHRNFYYPS